MPERSHGFDGTHKPAGPPPVSVRPDARCGSSGFGSMRGPTRPAFASPRSRRASSVRGTHREAPAAAMAASLATSGSQIVASDIGALPPAVGPQAGNRGSRHIGTRPALRIDRSSRGPPAAPQRLPSPQIVAKGLAYSQFRVLELFEQPIHRGITRGQVQLSTVGDPRVQSIGAVHQAHHGVHHGICGDAHTERCCDVGEIPV